MTLDAIIDTIGVKPYYIDGDKDNPRGAIYNADCLDILPLIPDKAIDLCLTDPPYGIDAEKHHGRKCGGKAVSIKKDYGYIGWDEKPATPVMINYCISKSDKAIIWGGNYFSLPISGAWLVWDKDNGSNPWADCELAWTNLDTSIRKFKHRWMGMLQEDMANKEIRVHPTQKPSPLFKWILEKYSQPFDLILDPFLGSGTTAVAAKQLGRKFIGIEISQKYCDIAIQRLQQEVMGV